MMKSQRRPDKQGMTTIHQGIAVYAVSPSSLTTGGGSSHPHSMTSRGESDHTCYQPHIFNELATKSEKWSGKPRMAYVSIFNIYLQKFL